MNNREAGDVLKRHLEIYRGRSYADLVRLIGEIEVIEINGQSGATYQLEMQVWWDRKPGGPVRVLGSIDDGGWRAFSPLCDSFLMGADGNLIGE